MRVDIVDVMNVKDDTVTSSCYVDALRADWKHNELGLYLSVVAGALTMFSFGMVFFMWLSLGEWMMWKSAFFFSGLAWLIAGLAFLVKPLWDIRRKKV